MLRPRKRKKSQKGRKERKKRSNQQFMGAADAERPETPTKSRNGQAGRPPEVRRPQSLIDFNVYQDIYPWEPDSMKELRAVTAKHPWNLMGSSADKGQLLNMLPKLINAEKTMEIGVYTGHSLLATALAIPDDGQILAMDINRKNYELGLPVIQKAGVAHKIDFLEGPALPVLDLLVEDEKNHGSFDFIFVDADKDNYVNYHKRLRDLVKSGGIIAYDNTLWERAVEALPDSPKDLRYHRDLILDMNKVLAADPRIDICPLHVGYGITLCLRVWI